MTENPEHAHDQAAPDQVWLAERFEEHRNHLRAVAYRVLGSQAEADDAIQEAWLRVSTASTDSVENLGGWLTTVVARVSLNMLRARGSRREDALDEYGRDEADPGQDPEGQAVLADSVGVALLVVLDRLSPSERLAFVLHDMFAVGYDDISAIVGKSPPATRQLVSRARRRVQGGENVPEVDPAKQRTVVTAFLAAAHQGDFEALVGLLHPDAVLTSDAAAVLTGAPAELRGASDVANRFMGAKGAQAALVDGVAGLVWIYRRVTKMVFVLTVVDDRVTRVDMVGDPDRIAAMDIVLMER